MRTALVLLLFAASPAAYARGGSGSANAEYKNPKSLKGFCTSDNEKEPFYKEGYCLSLAEQFVKNQCTKDALEEMRQRLLPNDQQSAAAKEDKKMQEPFNLGLSCDSKDGKKTVDDIIKDKSKFSFLMMQFMAMTTTQESGWDVLNNEQAGSKGPGGLLNLSLEKDGAKDMENKDYKCGCKDDVATTSGQSKVMFSGQSPGPLDGHHSETCGSYMALKNALKDGELFSGNKKKDPSDPKKDGRRGAARVYASLEAEDGEKDKKAEWRAEKMKTFCERYWSSSDSKVNPWNDEIGTRSAK